MTRYRIVCADGQVLTGHTYDDRATAEAISSSLDNGDADCGPHRVEEVPDGE